MLSAISARKITHQVQDMKIDEALKVLDECVSVAIKEAALRGESSIHVSSEQMPNFGKEALTFYGYLVEIDDREKPESSGFTISWGNKIHPFAEDVDDGK